ncbi:MAG: PKD domain-containing protein [Opitutaceae bacterium]
MASVLRLLFSLVASFAATALVSRAMEKPPVTYSVFQFPADQIPRIDGDPSDWAIVSESYIVGESVQKPRGVRPSWSITIQARPMILFSSSRDSTARCGPSGPPERTSYGHASQLCAFKLMPLEPELQPKIAAQWTWKVVDMDRRLVAFKDLSVGEITAWKWDFGDGATSTEQHPQHIFEKPGNYLTILEVTGPRRHFAPLQSLGRATEVEVESRKSKVKGRLNINPSQS